MRYACKILAFVCTFTAVEANLRLLFLFEVVFFGIFPEPLPLRRKFLFKMKDMSVL